MTFFMQTGTRFDLTDRRATVVLDAIPPANYAVAFDAMRSAFYLETVASFVLPSKIYGKTPDISDRVMTTFIDRPAATGLLMSGEKGSGKTLLAKILTLKAAALGMPTLLINSEFHGDEFNAFVTAIEQPCIFLFDEFEKVYSKDHQSDILTLLDGVFPTKKLFIMTVNDSRGVSEYMMNRPGRFFYNLKYSGLEETAVREYCLDKLEDQSQTDSIVRFANTMDDFNFDMLKAIVEEMNRYRENLKSALRFLNVTSSGASHAYEIKSFVTKKLENPWANPGGDDFYLPTPELYVLPSNIRDRGIYVNAIAGFNVTAGIPTGTPLTDDDNQPRNIEVQFAPTDIVEMRPDGTIVAENSEARIVMKRAFPKEFSIMDLL